MPLDPSNIPLLEDADLVRYDAVAPEHVAPAVDAAIADADAAIAAIERSTEPPTWTSFIEPLSAATERLGRVWSTVSHLSAVVDTPELRAAYNASLPKVTEFWTRLSQNTTLFDRYRRMESSPDFASLAPIRRRIVANALRDFRLSGAELPTVEKDRFGAIEEESAQLSQAFSEHVLDATNEFVLDIADVKTLDGLPDDALAAARARAEQAGVDGYRITLHMPSYLAVMQFAKDRALREQLYAAYAKRASEFGKPEQDNGPLITRILALRAEAAKLLAYNDYASYAMVSKMAESPDEVLAFLERLRARARPFGQRDMAELATYAREHLAIDTLEAWDISFVSERLREHRYAFSQAEVKAYFRESKVLDGLFRVVERLFGVTVRQRVDAETPPLWHADVKFFDLVDRDGLLVAQFYLDLYARPGKRGGAWMASARSRSLKPDGHRETPVAFLTCNFTEPLQEIDDAGKGRTIREALFTHSEVNTLFHEFGHGLHHMLTRIDEAAVSGIRGVEWDAVELPSQFLENFCWEWDVVEHMTSHIDTGQPIPRVLFDRMLAAKNFQAGMQTLRQLEFAIFDMKLHSRRFDDARIDGTRAVLDLLDDVRSDVAVFKVPAYNRQPHQFSHIFAGGYAAGYYSYKWAEVLVGRRLCAVRGRRHPQPGHWCALPRRGPRRRRQSTGPRIVRVVSRTQARYRSIASA